MVFFKAVRSLGGKDPLGQLAPKHLKRETRLQACSSPFSRTCPLHSGISKPVIWEPVFCTLDSGDFRHFRGSVISANRALNSLSVAV